MRWIGFVVVACAALAPGAVPARAATAEEVIAKHVEARGGREAWEGIKTMKLTGEFTAFSKIKPFTLYRTRDNRYYMDHHLGDKLVVIGYDGEKAWWDNRWFKEGAQEIKAADLAVLMREIEFVTPLFDYVERGFEAKLLGEVEVEGIPAIGIELTRSDESKETWYLDPATYLEIARDSPGSDFGRPMEQRTWFDDFREVDGVMIPFFSESQWYTRDRVMRVEHVETNVEIDDELFRMPAPIGMGPFQAMAGDWKVSAESRGRPGADWRPSERRSSIEAVLGGAMLRERTESSQGDEVLRTISYDSIRKSYRVSEISGSDTFLDILEGELTEDGRLVVSNMETGTPSVQGGMTIHGRLSIFDVAEDGFELEYEVTIDGGESWWVALKASYERATEMAEATTE